MIEKTFYVINKNYINTKLVELMENANVFGGEEYRGYIKIVDTVDTNSKGKGKGVIPQSLVCSSSLIVKQNDSSDKLEYIKCNDALSEGIEERIKNLPSIELSRVFDMIAMKGVYEGYFEGDVSRTEYNAMGWTIYMRKHFHPSHKWCGVYMEYAYAWLCGRAPLFEGRPFDKQVWLDNLDTLVDTIIPTNEESGRMLRIYRTHIKMTKMLEEGK